MQFANPIWLWGMTGLLIPIGIHLLSRKEGEVIRIGSLRHLEESHTKQSLNVKLNEIALLILRCLLISLVVLMLSGLSFDFFDGQKKNWVIVERGLDKDAEFKPLIDSLQQDGFEIRSMQRGFPLLSGENATPFISYWEMIEDLKSEAVDKVVVLSYSVIDRFKGQRIAALANVTWISKESAEKNYALRAVRLKGDSLSIRTGHTSSSLTSFTNTTERVLDAKSFMTSTGDSVKIRPIMNSRIAIAADDDFDYDKKIIVASLHAIEKTIPVSFEIIEAKPEELKNDSVDWTFWLLRRSPLNISPNAFVFREDHSGNGSILKKENSGMNGFSWIITRRLNEEIALEEELALKLVSILCTGKEDQLRAAALDNRSMPEKFLWSQERQTASVPFSQTDNSSRFLFEASIIALLIAERVLAFKRNA